MSTPNKQGYYMFNETIINTPQPQASSTVRRKNQLQADNKEQNVSYEKELTQDEEDISLGLLRDMSGLTNMSIAENEQNLNHSNTDAKLECARRLLQKCSDTKNSSLIIDTNKEKNANIENITDNLSVSSFNLPNEPCMLELDQESNINPFTNKASVDVTFDPNEITARSSDVNDSAKKKSLLSESFINSINFSPYDIIEQLNNENMAKLNNEEFLSGSKVAEQLSVDEARWQQDCTYCVPVTTTEMQELDLTSFSGIMGPLDLTLDSCGQKISIGQYFERKSADIGMLGNDKQIRPNFGLPLDYSVRKSNLGPLSESTILTDATSSMMEPKKEHTVANATRDMDKTDIISLSTILNALQNVDSNTPRRLVDRILMAQKRQNSPVMQNNIVRETYTLPSDRKSMLVMPTSSSNKYDENIRQNLSAKLSLDSQTKNEIKSGIVNVKQEHSRVLSFASNKNLNTAESFTNICKEKTLKEEASGNATSSFNQDAVDLKSYDESYNDLNIQRRKMMEVHDNIMGPSLPININTEIQHNLNSNVIIGKNTERLCNCIIGMTSEVNIEILNPGDRWITYSLKLNEVLGDMQSIELNIPQDEMLIKPNGVQSTKIKVKVTQMCEQIFVALNIILTDMVTKSKWCMKHMICINPEQLELEIMCDSHKEELDFQCVTKNSTKVLPITIHNKNSIDVPIKLSILHDGPRMFSIDVAFDKSIKLNESLDELAHVILKSHEKFITNIKCEPSTSMDFSQKQPTFCKGKLIIHVQCSDNTILFQKEVPLYAQMGTCKVQIVDTEDNYLRCHTPNNVISLSPVTSPQSATSSTSGGLYGRNSPISTVSSAAVAGSTIPIKSTHAALVWNSVKIGKNEIKEFTIRNTSNNKIKIQIDISDDNKSFKFLGDKQMVNTSMALAMQRQENKTLAVSFSPYHVGPVTGRITIKHYRREGSDSQQHKKIPLYGYGGYSKMKISNILKDTSGKMISSLGILYSETTVLTTNITLQNIGDLHSFAKIKIMPKVISPTIGFQGSSWRVKPKELILNPKEAQQVSIEFYPKKEDFAILRRSDVSHVATVSITYGDEPTRWRIRRLYNKIKESDNPSESEAFKNIVHSISKAFLGEQLPSSLLSIRDSVQNLNDLCTGVHNYEIMLTVEACADDTLPINSDADESHVYYPLNDTTQVDETDGASFFVSQTITEHETNQRSRLLEKQLSVTPSTVVLQPPVENEATVTVFSLFKTDEPFQTNVSDSNYFRVTPTEGMLPSRRNFSLKIQCLQRIERNMQAVLEIYTQNHKQDVMIKVIRRP